MADEPETQWLPPRAPGAEPPADWSKGLPESGPPPPPAPAPSPPAQSGYAAPAPGAQAAHGGQWGSTPSSGSAAPTVTHWPAQPAQAQPAGNGVAVAALVLGVAGLVLFVGLGFGIAFFVNLPCSILAWILGVQGKRKVDRGETSERRGMAHAGMVLGIVGVVAGVLGIVAWVLTFALSDDLRDEFRREFERRYDRSAAPELRGPVA